MSEYIEVTVQQGGGGFMRHASRTPVAVGGGRIEIVRYDRAGKWYREDGGNRTRITVAEAVSVAAQDRPAVLWHEGRPGGRAFDAKVRKARAARTAGSTGTGNQSNRTQEEK